MKTETNAENIEQAKLQLEGTRQIGARGGEVCVIGYENLKNIIQQAERVQELEEKINKWRRATIESRKDNVRFREALENLIKKMERHGEYGGYIPKGIATNIQWDIDEILQQEDSK